MIEHITISKFTKGDKIEGYFLIKSFELKKSSNGKNYIDIIMADSSGEIDSKLWEVPSEESVQIGSSMLFKIRGTVNEWRDQLQFKIEKIRNVSDGDNVKIEDFVKAAPYPSEEMMGKINSYIEKIDDKEIKNLVSIIIKKYKRKLLYYPAAKKNHHAIRGGLLYHILTILEAGESLLKVYDFLNSDLLYAGIILHDIGKIEEMNAGELGIVSDYTVEGKLIGHLIFGVKLIDKEAEKIKMDKEKSLLLQHMILSHHFQPDFGSPKYPAIPEAEMLHLLDLMDSRMYDIKNALEGTKKGEFTESIWSLDKRQFYNSEIIKVKSNE